MKTEIPSATYAVILSEVKSGEGIGLAEACKLIPPYRPGHRTHPATLTRWILRGVRSPHGDKIKLEAVRCGSRWITTTGAVERFLASQQHHIESADPQPSHRTPRARNAAAEAAVVELERMGA